MATKTKARTGGIVLSASELKSALAAVAKVITRPQRPILANVKIGEGLLTATDLEVQVDVRVDYFGESFLVPYQRLNAILRETNGADVTFEVNGSTVTVHFGSGKWTMPTESAAEFPVSEPTDLRDICTLPAEQFKRVAQATVYATDSESSRYALGGVNLEVEPTDDGSKCFWVATDGRRLAMALTENDQAVDASRTLIPSRVMVISQNLADAEGLVSIKAGKSDVQLEFQAATVTGRLVDGKFPESWRDTVKPLSCEPAVIARTELASAARAAAIVTSEQSKGLRLKWTAAGLVLHGKSNEYGESEVLCKCDEVGDSEPTTLDPRFLVNFVTAIDSAEDPVVKMFVSSPTERVLLECGPYTGVIMPLDPEA